MDHATCESCAYFLQHYAMRNNHLFWVYCGHCTFSKTARKKPDSKACDHYTPGEADRDAFASKEYLSKELLQYMLKLELMPEIQKEEKDNS